MFFDHKSNSTSFATKNIFSKKSDRKFKKLTENEKYNRKFKKVTENVFRP